MTWLAIYFVLLGDTPHGYMPPQEVRSFTCGLSGAVIGMRVNRTVNPTVALFPDPFDANSHCEESIAARVALLPKGEYELASTQMVELGSPSWTYMVDPHVSETWVRDGNPMDVPVRPRPSKPTLFRIIPP